MKPDEVRDLFERAIAGPQPPLQLSSADAVRHGRRLRRRRTAARTAVAGAVAAVMVTPIVAIPAAVGARRPPPTGTLAGTANAPTDQPATSVVSSAPPPPPGSPTVSPQTTGVLPPGGPVEVIESGPDWERAQRILRRLVAALPAGTRPPAADVVTAPDPDEAGRTMEVEVRGVQVTLDQDGVAIVSSTDVLQGRRAGHVSVVVQRAAPPPNDLCRAAAPVPGTELTCRVRPAADGVPARLGTRPMFTGLAVYATVYRGQEAVTVQQLPTGMTPGAATLGRVFTDDELVALAARLSTA